MAAICRAASRRRIARARGIAAAVLVLASLGLGGLAWLGGRHLGPDPFTAAAPFAGPEVLPEADALPPVPSVPSVPAAHGQRADLASSWWVIDPERDQDAEAGREFEAVLYSGDSADPVARDSGESRDFLILKALLGAGPARSGEPRAVPDLLMVPEADGAKGPIPLRPVALPLRIPARDIASTTRIRIRKPAMRYRIVWIDGGAPLHLVPTFGSGESRPPRGSFPLPSPLDERY